MISINKKAGLQFLKKETLGLLSYLGDKRLSRVSISSKHFVFEKANLARVDLILVIVALVSNLHNNEC